MQVQGWLHFRTRQELIEDQMIEYNNKQADLVENQYSLKSSGIDFSIFSALKLSVQYEYEQQQKINSSIQSHDIFYLNQLIFILGKFDLGYFFQKVERLTIIPVHYLIFCSSINFLFKIKAMNNINRVQELNKSPLVIGYYPIRGKAQVPRLLCQYLQISYVDQIFQLQQWNNFKQSNTKNWDFADLPFLIDGDFILTESFPICEYLIQKCGRTDLLGKTISDQGVIQMYLWTIDTMGSIISINCSKGTEQQKLEFKQNQWRNNVLPRLQKYEQYICGQGWFLGYLTIIDFSIYQLIRYMEMLFPNRIEGTLPKLERIKIMISQLPSIKEYEGSKRAVKQMDPSILLRKLKQT